MRFWIREIAGWALLGISLAVFYACWQMIVESPTAKLLRAGPFLFIGFILFRGGIHLLRVAVAARVCSKAQEQMAAGNQVRSSAFAGVAARPPVTVPRPPR
jgi:hypothetical protein